jgi:hypothetical protein
VRGVGLTVYLFLYRQNDLCMCDFLAPNGARSKVFDTVAAAYGEGSAVRTFSYINSPEFKAKYDGEFDVNGEPVISDGFFPGKTVNIPIVKVDQITERNIAEHVALAQNLKGAFAESGVDIKVSIDETYGADSYVVRQGEENLAVFNKYKLDRESVYHEFGHVYVDVIGFNDPLIQKGVRLLEGSELWNKIERLYPELGREALAKEVLTTAIGIHAAQQHDAILKYHEKLRGKSIINKIEGLLDWLKFVIQKFANKLGISGDASMRLAYDLTSGRLRNRVTGKLSTYKQYKKVTIEELKKKGSELQLKGDGTVYFDPSNPDLEYYRVTTFLELLVGEFDREAAIRASVRSSAPLYKAYTTEEEVAKLWADKREEGTGIHSIPEAYINGINAGKDRALIRAEILDNLYTPENAGATDEDGVRIYQGMNRDQVNNYIDVLFDFIDSLYAKGYTLIPELKIHHLDIAGTIDLLAVAPDGTLEIFDFKTKEVVTHGTSEVSKFDEWNTIHRDQATFMAEEFSDVPNTLANKYAMQLSLYKMILKRYGYDVAKMHIVPLVGRIEKTDDQYNYTSLKLYTGSSATAFNGVTFELTDYSQRLYDTVFGKADVETAIAEATKAAEETASYVEVLAKLDGTKEWLTDVIIDLEKSIAGIKRTLDVDKAERYEVAIRELIKKIAVTDEVEAITNYTKYIGKTLFHLHMKLAGKIAVADRNKDGSVSKAVFENGYATLTWNDIKEMEDNNKEEYMEFLAFMINAEHFLSQVVKIADINFTAIIDTNTLTAEEKVALEGAVTDVARKIEGAKSVEDKLKVYYDFLGSISGKHSEVIATLKHFEGKISDIRTVMDKLRAELNMRYFELTSNPTYRDGDLQKAIEMFFKAQHDETLMQRHLDPLGDTHHPFIANVVKMYEIQMHNYRQEAKRLTAEFADKAGEMVDLSKFVDANTGKFVTAIDHGKYQMELSGMFEYANSKFKKGSPEKSRYISNWFRKNTVPISKSEKDLLLTRMEKSMSKKEYTNWYNKQFIFDEDGNRYPKNGGAMFKPNPTVYANEVVKGMTSAELEFMDYMQSLMAYLTEHTKSRFFESGYVPALAKDDRSAWEQILAGIGAADSRSKFNDEVNVDESGAIIEMLPFKFGNKLAQQPYEKIPPGASTKVKKEIYAKNKVIKEQNEAAHAAAINQDLKAIMPIFIDMAIRHKYKKGMETELWGVQKSLEEQQKLIVEKAGRKLFDKTKRRYGLKNSQVEKSAKGSNIAEHYKNWMRMVFYEEFNLDEGAWTKIARVLQNYTSLRGMGFNPLSAVNNVSYGEIMTRIESSAGEFFDHKNWFEAGGVYFSGLQSYIADKDPTKFSSKANAFMHHFDIMMDFRELSIESNPTDLPRAVVQKLGNVLGASYFMQQAGEHYLQNRLLIAMAKSHKIVDGNIVSWSEFKRSSIKKVDAWKMTKEEADAIIAENKATEKTLAEKWKEHTSVWAAYDFVDGRVKLKDGITINKDQLALFERKVLGVNQYIHGVYNKEDAGAIQQYALGRLAIQFRKWMRPGWNKRWGSRMGEEFWNERRNKSEEGYYYTTIKFLASPVFKHFRSMKEDETYREQMTTMKAMSNIISDYGKFLVNARVHWHSLNDFEKQNVIRTMTEYLMLSALIGMLYLLKFIKSEDDDPPLPLLMAMYQVDRSATELTTYVPMAIVPGYAGGGWMNEMKKILKTPTATFGLLENAFAVGQNLMMYPFRDEDQRVYRNGIYHGQDKLEISLTKMIPFYNHYNRMENLERNYRFYKLF